MPEIQKIEIYKNKVIESVNQFLERDVGLLDLEAHEQAISHRIAVYLEYYIDEFHVDCEYNKNMENPKKIVFTEFPSSLENNCCEGGDDKSQCQLLKEYFESHHDHTDEITEKIKKLRPDIIVHRRRSNDKNEIIIEIKKTKDCNFDKEKLKLMTAQGGSYKYKLGVFIRFEKGTENNWMAKYTWFVDGAEYQF